MAGRDADSGRLNLEDLDPTRWVAIDRVVEALLDLPPEEVEGALDALCEGDPVLRGQALAVLMGDRAAQRFMTRSAIGLLKAAKPGGDSGTS